MTSGEVFVDVMEARRTKGDAFSFMTRHWRPQRAYDTDGAFTPRQLKEEVAGSIYMQTIIDEERSETGADERQLRAQLQKVLEEMGLERKMYVVRGLGVAFIKTVLAMKMGVFVNERRIFQLKGALGSNPVLFLPTHRSYADFCLMTYICYHYDIELPAVAAGMDFYHMAGMGRIMRDTCAFYIPRSLAGDVLRAHALRRYVRALVAHNPAPLEFFLEGARSRGNKSLAPKYGLLAMALLPLFTREVPDVTIVPVNISYDRIVEQTLFTYEHLGVPKPKETTRGLLKTLSFLNDNFGHVYINMARPFSARQYFADDLRPEPDQLLRPMELQELSAQQFAMVRSLADDVVVKQQDCTVVNTYNLVATLLMHSAVHDSPLALAALPAGAAWLAAALRSAGAHVPPGAAGEEEVRRACAVHAAAVRADGEDRLRLLAPPPAPLTEDVKRMMRGHVLKPSTMQFAVPLIQLQLYVNPAMHYLAPPALLVVALTHRRPPLPHEELMDSFRKLRVLHKYEFFYVASQLEQTMEGALAFCLEHGAVRAAGSGYVIGDNERLLSLLRTLIWPSLLTLQILTRVLRRQGGTCEHYKLWKATQKRVEAEGVAHPYCLSLEAIRNCIGGLVYSGVCIARTNGTQPPETHYETVEAKMLEAERLLRLVTPDVSTAWARSGVLQTAARGPLARL